MNKKLEDYEFYHDKTGGNYLGKGSYGCVRLVRDKQTDVKYALKILSKESIFESKTQDVLKREVKIQKKLDHPHICKLHHCFEDKDNVYLVLEYAENGSLFHYLQRRDQPLCESEAFIFFFSTCLGIDFLHKKNIIHRDLKVYFY